MAYRATRTEGRVAVGEWTYDLYKGEVLPTDKVPEEVAQYLMEHGDLVEVPDDAEDNPWFDSEETDRNGGVENDQTHGPLRSNVRNMT